MKLKILTLHVLTTLKRRKKPAVVSFNLSGAQKALMAKGLTN